MKNASFQSRRVQGVEHGKDNHFEAEYRRFRDYLKGNTVTCTMACENLGIRQKNATRYKRDLEENGELIELFVSKCKYTGFQAAYLTTNKEIIKSTLREKRKQLTLF